MPATITSTAIPPPQNQNESFDPFITSLLRRYCAAAAHRVPSPFAPENSTCVRATSRAACTGFAVRIRARGGVRLHHRRRGQRRLRARQPPVGGSRRTSVLLLEAGGKDDWFWIDIPVGYLYTIGNPRTDWCYRTEPDPGLNGRTHRLRARQGARRLLVDQRDDLHARPEGATTTTGRRSATRGWSWDDVLPYFKRAEDYGTAPTSSTARRRAARRGAARALGDPRRVARRGRGVRHPEGRRSSTAATTSATPTSR